jgi:hypothetical protein
MMEIENEKAVCGSADIGSGISCCVRGRLAADG